MASGLPNSMQSSENDSKQSNEGASKPAKCPIAKIMLPKIKVPSRQSILGSNETLRDRWTIKGLIGHGGYGEIYQASDTKLEGDVAVKVEPKKRKGRLTKRIILEQRALTRLQGRPHVPKMFASGQDPQLNFIVMQLLSVNLGDLKKASPVRRLSPTTVARIMIQGIAALRDMHTAHYIHRDVKPVNMCFGITKNSRHILMLFDLGLVRRYKSEDGQVIMPRKKAGFRGTLRYASVRVHARMDQSPADDLVSMAYSGLELLVGELPWKFTIKSDDVKMEKEELEGFGPNSMLNAVPEPMGQFCQAVFNLQQNDEPNYQTLQQHLFDMTGGRKLSDPYDWEEEYKEAVSDEAVLRTDSRSEPQ